MSNHEVTIEGDVVRKRYRRTDRGEPTREWAALVLLDRHAPGLAPRPLAFESDPSTVVMSRVTGEPARMAYRGIIGFGTYHYHYASGRQGDAAAAAFAPRAPSTTIYLPDGVGAYADELERLGPHRTGVGCLYLTDLAKVDLDVLERVVATSYAAVTAGTFGTRAREGGDRSD